MPGLRFLLYRPPVAVARCSALLRQYGMCDAYLVRPIAALVVAYSN
jgi:hypothetical protein